MCESCNIYVQSYNNLPPKKAHLYHGFFVTLKRSKMVLKQELKGNWSEQKAKLKSKFPYLVDQDLVFADGKKEQMLENLQLKLGKTRRDLYTMIEAL